MDYLLENQAIDTTTATGVALSGAGHYNGRVIWVTGTMDGATVTFVVRPHGQTEYVNIVDSADATIGDMTVTGVRELKVFGQCTLKANVSGAGVSTNITAGVSEG